MQLGTRGNRKLPEFTPYSEYANKQRKKRKTDEMTAQQIIDHLCENL